MLDNGSWNITNLVQPVQPDMSHPVCTLCTSKPRRVINNVRHWLSWTARQFLWGKVHFVSNRESNCPVNMQCLVPRKEYLMSRLSVVWNHIRSLDWQSYHKRNLREVFQFAYWNSAQFLLISACWIFGTVTKVQSYSGWSLASTL